MPVSIVFEGLGEGYMAAVQKARDATAGLLDGVEKTNAATKKFGQDGVQSAEKFAQGVAIAGGAVAELNKQAGGGFTTKLAKDLTDASKSATAFGQNIEQAGDLSASAFAQLVTEARNAAREQGIVVRSIDAGKKATIDSLVAAKALTAEEGKLAIQAVEVLDAFKAQEQKAGASAAGLTKSAAAGTSLRTQLRAAREELARLQDASNGRLTPELIAAAQNAGRLQDRFNDVNATIQAFNPDAKFQAFSSVIQSGAGALTAFQGAMGLVGVQSEEVQETLLKVQSALAISQGLQAFFGGFRDGVRNIRAVLLSLTVAQQASTAATVVDTAAKGGQAAATVVATTATSGLTAALNAFKVAALSNPFTLILAALAVIVGTIIALTSETEEATESYEDFLDTLNKRTDAAIQLNKIRTELALLAAEGIALATGTTDTEQAIRTRNNIIASGFEHDIEAAKANTKAQEEEAERLRDIFLTTPFDNAENRDKRAADYANSQKALEDSNNALQGLRDQAAAAELDGFNKIAAFRASAAATEKQQNDQRIREIKEFNDSLLREIDRLNTEIASRIQKAQLDAADPRERIALEQRFREQEIATLERDLLRKLAVIELQKTLSVAAIKDLSEAELNARADALIAEGKVRLDPKQVEELNKLRFAVEQEGQRALSELLIKEANARIEIIANAQDREQAQFEAGLQAKLTRLRENSIEETEVQAFADRERAKFVATRTAAAIDAEEKIATAEIDAQIAGAGENERLRTELELRKLDILRAFAKQRLALIAEDTTQEAAVQRAGLEKTIAEIDAAAAKLQRDQKPLSILDLLGIKPEDQAEVSSALQSIFSSVQQIIQANIAQQQAEVEARITATDQIIEDAQRRGDELQQQLDRELEAQRLGLANNVDATREAIEANRREQEKALADKKRLVAEQQKLARQQALADSITQVSALLTAGATLFAKGAFTGPAGILTSIATIAAMIAAFVSLKARASQVTQFRYGGVEMLEGPDHYHGGLAVIDRRTGEVKAEAEGREASIGFVRREAAHKAMPYLKALNTGGEPALLKVAAREIERVTKEKGIQVDRKEVSKIVENKEMLLVSNTVVQREDNDELRKELKVIGSKVDAFMRQEGDRAEVITLPSGAVRVKKGNKTIVYKARKRNK